MEQQKVDLFVGLNSENCNPQDWMTIKQKLEQMDDSKLYLLMDTEFQKPSTIFINCNPPRLGKVLVRQNRLGNFENSYLLRLLNLVACWHFHRPRQSKEVLNCTQNGIVEMAAKRKKFQYALQICKLCGLFLLPFLLAFVSLDKLDGKRSICLIKNVFGMEC